VDAKLTPEKLFADLIKRQQQQSENLPPVHLWCPEKTGHMDLRIDREGRWLHEGAEIKRPAMVKLFSSILRREGDNYFLVTPVEKWQITVDIAPFYMVYARRELRDSVQVIRLISSTDDEILLDDDHPLIIERAAENGAIAPLVTVRDNLQAVLSRSVYYQLIDWGRVSPSPDGENELVIDSLGCQFSLGRYPA